MGASVPATTKLAVEIWSDVVCPWCYIGKRRFERAVAELSGEIEVDVVYRPFQLDPTASPGRSAPVLDAYAKKFGGPERAQQIVDHVTRVAAEDGLEFRLDRALRANTLLAHRLLALAETTGHQQALKERLLQAYFVDGLDVGDPDVLAESAAEVGMPRDEVLRYLDSGEGTDEVQAHLRHAADREITAVPTYVIADPRGRAAWMVPGAQDSDVFVQVMRRIAERIAAADQAEAAAAAADHAGVDASRTDG